MPEESTKFGLRHKLLLASLATVTLSLGVVGVVSATQNPTPPKGGGTSQTEEVDGVDCEDGIDTATGAECDGGPAANADNDPNEADTEASEADEANESEGDEAEEVDGVDCEDGLDTATGAECDGGPAANPTDGADDGDVEDANK